VVIKKELDEGAIGYGNGDGGEADVELVSW
jgi:hypothetical protein